ncbi:MAG: 50S ribosomal protein L35 [Armatimonadetes bacterium]|nr:50S ribosomal protein L35 [Armatimonadota bacterium]
MPKIKTHRGAAKRFKKTATKKIKASHAFHSHLLGKKTARRKRRLRQGTVLNPADAKRVKRLLPY